MPSYLICGLHVNADRPLPGAIPFEADETDETDVAFAVGEVPEQLDRPTQRTPFWEFSHDAFLWRMPGLGSFVARAGNQLTARADPDAQIEDLLPFALGTGLGALLYQRGAVVLHASAVAFEGRAYVLCGASGSGKSTLAAALCAAGAQFLSDDVTRITLDAQGRPVVNADGRCLKLTARSISRLELDEDRGAQVRSDIEKYYVAPSRIGSANATLGGVYFLDFDRRAATTSIVKLSPLNAAQSLLDDAYRPRLALALMRPGAAPRITAAILRDCGLFTLARPETLEGLDETVARLLAHWRGGTA